MLKYSTLLTVTRQYYFLDSSDPDSHATLMERKTAVSDWLKSVVGNCVEREVQAEDSSDGDDPKKVFSFLTGNQISEASEAAQRLGNLYLSWNTAELGWYFEYRTVRNQ